MDEATDLRCDVLVVGGGPAGLAAAHWLGRYRQEVVVVDRGEPRNRWVHEVHGYLGLEGIHPAELLDRARSDLARFETVMFHKAGVVSLAAEGERFRAVTDIGEINARRVVLAAGAADEFPEIEGFDEHYGAGLFTCPACDGFEAKDRRAAVVGSGDQLADFARTLLHWASSVVLIADPGVECGVEPGDRRDDDGLEVLEGCPFALVGTRGALRAVALTDGRLVDCDIAFFSIANHPSSHLARQLGCECDDEGYVLTDDEGQTSVAGVYAAGDLLPQPHIVQVAAATGAIAGLACAHAAAAERAPQR